jgi:hypothetical protein
MVHLIALYQRSGLCGFEIQDEYQQINAVIVAERKYFDTANTKPANGHHPGQFRPSPIPTIQP